MFCAADLADAIRNDEIAAVPESSALIAIDVNDHGVRGAHAGGPEAYLFAPGAKADEGRAAIGGVSRTVRRSPLSSVISNVRFHGSLSISVAGNKLACRGTFPVDLCRPFCLVNVREVRIEPLHDEMVIRDPDRLAAQRALQHGPFERSFHGQLQLRDAQPLRSHESAEPLDLLRL